MCTGLHINFVGKSEGDLIRKQMSKKVELFICEDSSFVQQKCTRVLCAVT